MVVERSHVSGEFFNLYLHQNYLDFFSEVEDVDKASQYLSDADLITSDWMVSVFQEVVVVICFTVKSANLNSLLLIWFTVCSIIVVGCPVLFSESQHHGALWAFSGHQGAPALQLSTSFRWLQTTP